MEMEERKTEIGLFVIDMSKAGSTEHLEIVLNHPHENENKKRPVIYISGDSNGWIEIRIGDKSRTLYTCNIESLVSGADIVDKQIME